MTIIDSQVHAYEANTPKRPWHSVPNWPDHVTGDEMVAAMDKVGVDGAIFISSFSMYQYDGSYAVEVQRAHPGRMAIVKPVDPENPDVADVVAEWKKTPGTVGIRIMLTKENGRGPDHEGIGRIARAAVRYDFPVNVLCWGQSRRRHGADRSLSRHAIHPRPSRHPAAARAAGTAATMGGAAKSAGARQTPQCGDQGQRRLHAVEGAVSVSRYLGSAGPRVRRLGL
jgi:hypothetical protein